MKKLAEKKSYYLQKNGFNFGRNDSNIFQANGQHAIRSNESFSEEVSKIVGALNGNQSQAQIQISEESSIFPELNKKR